MSKKWFKHKNYGYGWYPSSWQAWTITVGYSVNLILFAFVLRVFIVDVYTFFVTYFLIVIVETILFIMTTLKTGEPRLNMDTLMVDPVKKKKSMMKSKTSTIKKSVSKK